MSKKNVGVPLRKGAMALAALGLLSGLGGCASVATKSVDQDFAQAQKLVNEKTKVGYEVKPVSSSFSREAGFWVEKKPLASRAEGEGLPLPPAFHKSQTQVFPAQARLSEIVARMSRATGLVFYISPDVYEGMPSSTGLLSNAAAGGAAGAAAAPVALPPLPAAGTMVSASVASSGAAVGGDVFISDLVYNGGDLAGLLNTVANKTNLAWKWDGQRVVFYRYETRVFKLEALTGLVKTDMKVSNEQQTSAARSSGGGGATSGVQGTSGSGQTTTMTVSNAIWDEIGASVKGQVSRYGSVAMMPSAGTITVTDTPQKLDAIGRYLTELNKSLGKQVMINVDVYAVENTDADNYGIDWNIVWGTLNSRWGINYKTTGNTTGVGNSFTLDFGKNGPWNGSQALAAALSSVGKTSLVTSSSVTTLNNFPAPVNVIKEQAYLASVETTVTGTTGVTQTSLKPGYVTSGFSMNLTPRLLDNDRMLLQCAMDLSDLLSLDEYSSGENKIQIPTRAVRNFLQRVGLRSGETLVLSGFQQTQAKGKVAGIGSAQNWMAGGSKKMDSTGISLVIVITPYVMGGSGR